MAGLITRPLIRTSQHCSRRNIALTAVAGDALNGGGESSTDHDPLRKWREQKSWQLLRSLRDPTTSPSRVWSYYKDFFLHAAPDDLALDIHQQVLRRCVAPTQDVRKGAAARIRSEHGRNVQHLYESRLQRVIHLIRSAGMQPTVDDYNFVLEQFAAAGYQSGAWKVFEELAKADVEPSGRTYALVLQAVAYRLELPCAFSMRKEMHREASHICDSLLDDMDARGFSAQSIHVDLCLRITRTTGSVDSFLQLLRQAYGIDLENPDRRPLTAEDTRLPSLVNDEAPALPELQPFSVHVLNTILNFLGSANRVSQMILAYEVLTNPLPTRRPSSSPFSDDDDDAHAFYDLSGSSAPSFCYSPSASPNTTTFIFMIKHLARLGKQSLVRHYLNDAIRQEQEGHNRLEVDMRRKPLEEVAIPKVSVRKSALEPALGLGNRTRRVRFLMWLWRETKGLQISKREWLAYYTSVQHQLSEVAVLEEELADAVVELLEDQPDEVRLEEPVAHAPSEPDLALWTPPVLDADAVAEAADQVPDENDAAAGDEPIAEAQPEPALAIWTPSTAVPNHSVPRESTAAAAHPLPETVIATPSGEQPVARAPSELELATFSPPSALGETIPSFTREPPPRSIDLDLEGPSPSLVSPPSRPFSLPVLITLLEKDTREIQELITRIRPAVWRLTARRKEWLGRRVWAGKNIYLTDAGGRTIVSREKWVEIAGFKEPWKVGKRASLVKLQDAKHKEAQVEGKRRRFVLPTAVPHDGVERQFLDPLVFLHRPTVQWRRG